MGGTSMYVDWLVYGTPTGEGWTDDMREEWGEVIESVIERAMDGYGEKEEVDDNRKDEEWRCRAEKAVFGLKEIIGKEEWEGWDIVLEEAKKVTR